MSQFILTPHEERSIWLDGLGVNFKLDAEQTGGLFSVVEFHIDPGIMIRPHMHMREDEFSYVLEGKVGARIGDQVLEATPGCYIIKPRGILHTFWNAGSQPARLIEIISPAGFEKYFIELDELFKDDGEPDFEKLSQLSDKYEQKFDLNWVPELSAKFNLKLLGQSR